MIHVRVHILYTHAFLLILPAASVVSFIINNGLLNRRWSYANSCNGTCLKSIVRCTSVCKSWYSLIKSHVFITLHLRRPNNTKYLFCDYKLASNYQARYVSIHYDNEAFLEHYRLVFPDKLNYGMFIHGCCNGLICYTTGDGLIYLWNPTIRKLKIIPRYPNHICNSCFGFWFDKRVNDYIVAKLSTMEKLFIDVYSLSTNSWKTVAESIPAKSVASGRELAYVDGTLHWPAESGRGWMICSLDIKSGMLSETMISWASNKKMSKLHLIPLGEKSFAVFGSENSRGLCLWRSCMVQVYDQNMNKLYTIDLKKDTCHELQRVIGLRNNGEALFPKLKHDDSEIISCNTQTKDFKKFVPELKVTKEQDGSFQHVIRKLDRVRPFIETLVLLNEGDAEETLAPNHQQLTFKRNFPSFIWLVCLCVIFGILCFSNFS